MQTNVQKWGNSLGVRIPRAFASDLRLAPGTSVDVSLEADGLRIRPVRRRYELGQLLKQVTKRNRHAAVDSGGPVGREGW